ncbi:MAG: SMI1/KNR4 family protein [Pseudomonadota bacterium]
MLAPEVVQAWTAKGVVPARDDEIAALKELWGGQLPEPDERFLLTYGFVSWTSDLPASFKCDVGEADIREMFTPSSVRNCIDLLPDAYLAIAGDYSGHGLILLAKADGSVWFEEDGDLVQVAKDFDAFLAILYRAVDPDARAPWYGSPERDRQSGFHIAPQTRTAWAAYGTGDMPEPESELAEIEAALGRPLPEALRTFLSRFGHVCYFGDAIATFACPRGQEDQVSIIYAATVLRRSLPSPQGAALPFASTAREGGELLIGLDPENEGRIYWRCDETPDLAKVSDDLRTFLGSLYTRDY